MEVYLVCFDISDDDLRRNIGNHLLRFGSRVQRSVFEISVKDHIELDQLCHDLADLTSPEDDDIRLYRICANCRDNCRTLAGDPIAVFPALLIV